MQNQPTSENTKEDGNDGFSSLSNNRGYHPPGFDDDDDGFDYPSSFTSQKEHKSHQPLSTSSDDEENDDTDEETDEDTEINVKSQKTTPSSYRVHAALIIVQIIFGISAVVGSIGLPSFHPLTFALYRETSASILLAFAAHVVSIRAGRVGGLCSGSCQDLGIILLAGFGIFASQACFIVGIKLSGAIAASVWQPSQPILTAAACMLLKWEPYNTARVIGILIAFFGCAVMVVGGDGASAGESIGGDAPAGGAHRSTFSNLIGQASFFVNCLGSALYVLTSKVVLSTGRYESLAVTAWGYIIAASLMGVVSSIFSLSPTLTNFLCSDCIGGNPWHVPKNAIPAMIFFVIFTSSTAYALMTWANKYATGTLVIGYSVMQPVASAILIQVLVTLGMYHGCSEDVVAIGDEEEDVCLDEPDLYTLLGAIGVFSGLFIIIWTEPKKEDTLGAGAGLDLICSSGKTTQSKTEVKSLLEMKDLSNKDDLSQDTFNYLVDDNSLGSLEGQD